MWFLEADWTIAINVIICPSLVKVILHVLWELLALKTFDSLNDFGTSLICIFFQYNLLTAWLSSGICCLNGIMIIDVLNSFWLVSSIKCLGLLIVCWLFISLFFFLLFFGNLFFGYFLFLGNNFLYCSCFLRLCSSFLHLQSIDLSSQTKEGYKH